MKDKKAEDYKYIYRYNDIGKRDSNTHCLTMDVFAIFQLVGFDRRQPACILPH